MHNSVLLFLNIGGPEMILIMFVALLLFGGEKLPQIARGLGKGIRDFKDASEGVKREITNQINSYEEKKSETSTEISASTTQELPPVAENTDNGHTEEQNEVINNIVYPRNVAGTMPYKENSGSVVENHTEKVTDDAKTTIEEVKTSHE